MKTHKKSEHSKFGTKYAMQMLGILNAVLKNGRHPNPTWLQEFGLKSRYPSPTFMTQNYHAWITCFGWQHLFRYQSVVLNKAVSNPRAGEHMQKYAGMMQVTVHFFVSTTHDASAPTSKDQNHVVKG